jgi:hypothetical protein
MGHKLPDEDPAEITDAGRGRSKAQPMEADLGRLARIAKSEASIFESRHRRGRSLI